MDYEWHYFKKVCGKFFSRWYEYIHDFTLMNFDNEATEWLYVFIHVYIYFIDSDSVMDILIVLWWYYVVLRAPMDDLLHRSYMGRNFGKKFSIVNY